MEFSFLGFLFIMSLQLNMEEVKLLMNYTKGSLRVTDVKEWLRVHETELDFRLSSKDPSKTNDKKAVFLTEVAEGSEYQEAEENDGENFDYEVLLAAAEDLGVDEPPEEFEEADAREILATMVRDHRSFGGGKGGGKRSFQQVNRMKKNKELAREYGVARKGPGTYRVSIEELKRRTKCANCRQTGHWHRECPSKSGNPTSAKEVQFLESDEAMFVNFLEYQDFKHGHEVHHLDFDPLDQAIFRWHSAKTADQSAAASSDQSMAQYKERSPDRSTHELLLMEQYKQLARADIDERTCATVDTGCQRSAIGLDTLHKLCAVQPSSLAVTMIPEEHKFCSVHGVSTTSRIACIPNSIGPHGSILRPAVFEEEHSSRAPFLLSLPFLLECRTVLELDPVRGLSVHFRKFNHKIALHLGPTGALRVPLHEFTPAMISHLQQGVQKIQSPVYTGARNSCNHGSSQRS